MKKFYILFLAVVALLFNSCIEEPLIAAFSFESTGAYTISFTNVSLGATRYEWDFGDGKTSNEKEPTHTYESAGTYRVILTAYDSKGNNDDVTKNVIVNKPVVYWVGYRIEKVKELNKYYKVILGSKTTIYSKLITSSNLPYTYMFNNPEKIDDTKSYKIELRYGSSTSSESSTTLCVSDRIEPLAFRMGMKEYGISDVWNNTAYLLFEYR